MSYLHESTPVAEAIGGQYVAFAGTRRVGRGPLVQVAREVKQFLEATEGNPGQVLVLDAITSRPLEVRFDGPLAQVLANLPNPAAQGRLAPAPVEETTGTPAGPGRPRLGVVAREVTLLPRHWEWLAKQPGGASVTLRKLVEAARKGSHAADAHREAVESADRFMRDVAGDLPGFEEASRALYRNDGPRLRELVTPWPEDVREHLMELVER